MLHPIIDLLKRIVVALPDYAGGGGGDSSLLSMISDLWSNTTCELRGDFPEITTIAGQYLFYKRTNITKVNFPYVVLNAADACFNGCTNITEAHFPRWATNNSRETFLGCTSLQLVELGVVNRIRSNCFQNCTALQTLILRKSSIVELENINAFTASTFASGGTGGTIYIPKALYDHLGDETALDYKSATNWSTIDGYGTITWEQIEGSYYETHYADGTVIE